MTERPILFNAPMVRAILKGEKTQTRRIIKPQPLRGNPEIEEDGYWRIYDGDMPVQMGRMPFMDRDLLWVRETWQTHCDKDSITPRDLSPDIDVQYPATYDHWVSRKRPGIHMPRWASRITLEIIDVRVERLNSISEGDARAEGVERLKSGRGFYSVTHGKAAVHFGVYHDFAKEAFAELWDSINGAGAWDNNPWVYALNFRVIKPVASLGTDRKALESAGEGRCD